MSIRTTLGLTLATIVDSEVAVAGVAVGVCEGDGGGVGDGVTAAVGGDKASTVAWTPAVMVASMFGVGLGAEGDNAALTATCTVASMSGVATGAAWDPQAAVR